ncbi:MAG: hypothetical protein WCP29_02880 [Acidobacteriota bacterium]
MITNTTYRRLYAAASVALAVALIASGVRAQANDFYAKRTEILKQAAADRKQAELAGNANRKKLYTLYPTPEIPLTKPVVVAAGSSGVINLVGKFPDKTTFISRDEGVELSNVVVAANSVKATVTIAVGVPPSWGRIYAFAPVSGAEAWVPAIFIGTPQTFNLSAKNGWTIKLAPVAPAFSITKPGTASALYKAEYYKPDSTTPFETSTGTVEIEAESSVGQYNYMMSVGAAGAIQAEYQEIAEKIGALIKAKKYTGPEMAALQKRSDAMSARLGKELQEQNRDPAAAQKKQDDFGCQTISLWITKAKTSGNISCGKNVGTLDFTVK